MFECLDNVFMASDSSMAMEVLLRDLSRVSSGDERLGGECVAPHGWIKFIHGLMYFSMDNATTCGCTTELSESL